MNDKQLRTAWFLAGTYYATRFRLRLASEAFGNAMSVDDPPRHWSTGAKIVDSD